MPRHGRTAAAALAVLACLAAPALAAGDVDSMVLAGGRVGLDTPAELSLAVTPEQLLTDASPPPCREGFDYCLYLPAEAYAGTNLRSAGLAVTRREDLRAPASCLLAQPDGWSGLQPGVVYEGPGSPVATSRFGDVGEGAAGSYTLGEVLRQMDIPCEDPALLEQRVLAGGPVHPERGFVVHDGARPWDSSLEVADGLWVTTSRDILEALAGGDGPEHAAVALGCAGWARASWNTRSARTAGSPRRCAARSCSRCRSTSAGRPPLAASAWT